MICNIYINCPRNPKGQGVASRTIQTPSSVRCMEYDSEEMNTMVADPYGIHASSYRYRPRQPVRPTNSLALRHTSRSVASLGIVNVCRSTRL